jgi:hypothetical protein
MNIQTALEGREVCYSLSKELSKLRYNPDLTKMLRNIENMVTEISKLEVICRRSHSRAVLETPLKKLNDAVDHLQKLILVAKLMD